MQHLALEAGKHVYVEKPASFNIAESVSMINKAKAHPQTGRHRRRRQQRSGQHFKDAKAFIDEGNLGKIGFCRTWITNNREALPIIPDSKPPASLDYEMWVGPAPYQPYNKYGCHYWWHFQKNYGNRRNWATGAHTGSTLHAGISTSTCPLRFRDKARKFVDDAKQTPDTQTVIYEFPSVTLLWEQRIWTDYNINNSGSGIELAGEKGTLVVTRSGWTFFPKGEKPQRHDKSNLIRPHVQNFADVIHGKAACNAPMEEGAKSATMCHLGNLVAKLNRRLEFNAATQDFVNDPEASALRKREYRTPWTTLTQIEG